MIFNLLSICGHRRTGDLRGEELNTIRSMKNGRLHF